MKVRLKLLNCRRFKNSAKIDEIDEYFVSNLCALNQTTHRRQSTYKDKETHIRSE